MIKNRPVVSYISKQLASIILILSLVLFFVGTGWSYGGPNYLPDGPHPRIWLTPSIIADLKAKKTANTAAWQALITRCEYIIAYDATHTSAFNSNYSLYSWPDGDGYVGSGFNDAIVTLGLAYQTLKSPNYGTGSAMADDINALRYATEAFNIINRLIAKYSAGEEQDGIEFIRLSDDKSSSMVTFNVDEAASLHMNGFTYTTNGNQAFKSGYAARSLAQSLPIFYDWFYNDPLMTTQQKTTLYKIMYRHIDWYNAVRSAYNNGILINGIRYHEDSFGKDSNGNAITGACTGNNNCNVAKSEPYKAYGYANPSGTGRIGSNFYSPFAGLAMLNAVAVYGDPPQADADHYLNYAKSLWTRHHNALSDNKILKGGDSLEGLAYNSCWESLFQGILGLYTATGLDTWSTFDFPKEVVKNYIHNTDSTLTTQMMRGALNKPQNTAYWTHPTEYSMNTFSHILRNYYAGSDEAKQLQYFLNNASLTPRSDMVWQRFLFRDDTSVTKDFSAEPLYYRSVGSGVVTTRSSWSLSATDTVMAQIILGGIFNVDHQAQDQGSIQIKRGQDRLLSRFMDSSTNSDETSQGQNSIVFGDGVSDGNGLITTQSNDSGMTSGTSRSAPLSSPCIDRIENGSGYFYARGEVSNIFAGSGNTNLAKYFRRSLVHIRPGFFVIYDVTRSNSGISNKKSWYMQFEANPTIDTANRLVSANVGNSKIFIKGLYPTGGAYTTTNLSTSVNPNFASAFYRTKYEPATLQEFDQFLHVIETTASSSTNMIPTEMIQTVEGKMMGAYIKDASSPTIVLFNANQNGGDLVANAGDTITYTASNISGASINNILVDLPVNSDITILPPQVNSGMKTFTIKFGRYPDEGVVTMSSSQGVLNYTSGLKPKAPSLLNIH